MSDSPVAAPRASLRAVGVLDAEALTQLQALDPEDRVGLLDRVLNTFIRSLHRLLEQLGQARAAGDLQSQRHVVHTLKSSAASVGALKLAAQCANIEAGLRDGATEALAGALDALAAEGQRLLGLLRAT